MRPLAAAALFLCAGLGCVEAAWATPRADGAAELAAQQIANLERDVLRLRQENRVAEVEMARLRQVITRLEAELAAAREQLERQRARDETADLSAQAEASTENGLLAATDPLEEEVLTDEELDAPTRHDETPQAPAPPPDASPPALQAVNAAARDLYDDSYTLFHEKSFGEAESGFRRFLELYPATELTDNAQFWIGECRFAQGRYQEALDAFLATVERFPDGNKVPDAIYKAGKSLEALGDRTRAIATYEEAVRRFPASAAAASAQERLLELH